MTPPSPGGRHGGRRPVAGGVRDRETFDPATANAEKIDTLRSNELRRRARRRGYELRHSDHGYSLIDAGRNRVGDRNDLTLDEVAAHLDHQSGAAAPPT